MNRKQLEEALEWSKGEQDLGTVMMPNYTSKENEDGTFTLVRDGEYEASTTKCNLPSEYRETIIQVLEESLSSKESNPWKPIETAPKDTKILGYAEGWSNPCVVYWIDTVVKQGGKELNAGYWALDDWDDVEPTHWMPLPEAPNVE